jgi:hypothetical protein
MTGAVDLSQGRLLKKLPPLEAAEKAVLHYAELTSEPGMTPDGAGPMPGGPHDVINLVAGLCVYCEKHGAPFQAILVAASQKVRELRAAQTTTIQQVGA